MEKTLWILEVLEAVSLGVFVIGSYLYVKHLFNIRKKRSLSSFEQVMYILIVAAFVIIAARMLVEIFFV
ncbi:hypothetical protein JNUCC1_02806 [Lentibacillus sp. JNUCC-1]|uniref:hypothetical protein n=1 Tax=Lentibacillus sp. JNUCC-1 TaxID=2654513 RepID=UPI0012E82A97|nr:hypothetical protein [Lentibacillus sp. JNUCC-1]MUV38934.1 hypothetical protein [Lentibacillus sp. JNUCC-1]